MENGQSASVGAGGGGPPWSEKNRLGMIFFDFFQNAQKRLKQSENMRDGVPRSVWHAKTRHLPNFRWIAPKARHSRRGLSVRNQAATRLFFFYLPNAYLFLFLCKKK